MLALNRSRIYDSEETAYHFFLNLEKDIMSDDSKKKSIHKIETDLFENLKELGRRLIQEHIDSRGTGDVGEGVVNKDEKN